MPACQPSGPEALQSPESGPDSSFHLEDRFTAGTPKKPSFRSFPVAFLFIISVFRSPECLCAPWQTGGGKRGRVKEIVHTCSGQELGPGKDQPVSMEPS